MVKMIILRPRCKASSIFEVTVAMVLILAMFVSATLIYLNVTSAYPMLRKLKYEAYLEDAALTAIRENDLIDLDWKDETVTIYRTVQPYQNNANLLLLSFEASDPLGKTIAQYKILLYVPEI